MSDDLISRQAALGIIQSLYPGMPRIPSLLKDWRKRYEPYINTEKAISALPSAQPERKKGKWICLKAGGSVKSTAVHLYPVCSECGCEHPITNYCPNCGAEMEGSDELRS